ncbi:energy-coupling factor transporter transmembrane component T family protein [Risungbinella massiliensis]|uniref:energy-coupling factor transporter transmembrane component T family protein n=1 Tax=Risungbinella massiliensis TaxID=1329796 RepID=UPI0005CBD304|nr:energy-coupling factor transporter transmembrane component T [Risungbinella massiliensis]
MKSISLFVERDSFVHRIDPISKIVYILFAIAVPIILPMISIALVCSMMSIALLVMAKVFWKSLPIYGFVLLVLSTVLIIQSLFYEGNTTPLFSLGSLVFYQEGLLYALLISLRVINIVGAFMILVLTTKPSDLVESLVRKGLSPRFGYVLQSVFQIIPQMMSTMGTITDAQRSRGMETEGNLWVRMKAFLPLLGPVVLNSLIQTKERAMALEVRGFNASGQKTYLHEEKSYAYSHLIQGGLVLLVVLAVVWRVIS